TAPFQNDMLDACVCGLQRHEHAEALRVLFEHDEWVIRRQWTVFDGLDTVDGEPKALSFRVVASRVELLAFELRGVARGAEHPRKVADGNEMIAAAQNFEWRIRGERQTPRIHFALF